MKTLNVTFTATNKDLDTSVSAEIDVIYNTDLEDILNEVLSENDIEDNEGWELSDKITSEEDIHSNYLSLDEIFEFAEAYDNSNYELDVINAGIDADISLSNIDEAYSGEFDNDADFAEDMADQLGSVDKNASWPLTCIDWEQAAKELMYDYTESNGFYFRNF